MHILNTSQLDKDSNHEAIPFGGGWTLQVQGIRQDGTKKHTGSGLGWSAIQGEETVSDDGTHRSPWADVNVDWHVSDDGGVLQSVVIDDTNNAINLKLINNQMNKIRVKQQINS